MRALLMFDDRDFTADREQPCDTELTQDLDLEVLWRAAAGRDDTVYDSLRSAMADSLASCDQVRYRQQVLADCVRQPDALRSLYQLAVDTVIEEREIYRARFFSASSAALLSRSVTAMHMFEGALRRLRELIDQYGGGFTSAALRRLSDMVHTELDEQYFVEVSQQLQALRFKDGLLASARLGSHNQGIEYVLRTPNPRNRRSRVTHHPPIHKPVSGRTIPNDDDTGGDELAALRDRVLRLAAEVLAESAQHVLGFFTTLRNELAFYIGCVELRAQLMARGLPACYPEVHPPGSGALDADALCEPCLALRTDASVHGNDVHADGKPLVLITGANQGGKSTFLRSVGVAQLMMRAGMFVAAESFSAAISVGVFTHFRQAEDATMTRGKFDEELQRMNRICRRIRPGSLLICNESFAATNEREGAEVAGDVLRAMTKVGVTVVFVTHNYDLARRYLEQDGETTLFLRAESGGSGPRSFRIAPGAPSPTSSGCELFDQIFGPVSKRPATPLGSTGATSSRPPP